ncbi:MAG TPA: CusA/CzcA family heavy metal efflux RND transporter [Saprospiraceae bacterium]|nr:CusA/CzcA family heavy metal efflux RND transporter [Saprospiraceae bacterium]
MLNKIIEFSISNKLIIVLFIIGLVSYGLYETSKLPIDAVPDITDNQVQIITQAPSYGALDIERLVTFPIEQNCNNISGIKEIRSFSRFGLSLVTVVFHDHVDLYWARQQIAEKLIQARAYIPKEIGNPELGPISTGLGEIYQYVIRPKKGYEHQYDAVSLRTIQDWIVRRQLLGVPGVAEVSSFGGKLKQYEIALNPDRLNSFGISIKDVFTALENNNQNTGGAYIEKGPQVLFIRTEGLIRTIDDIKNIAIAKPNMEVPLMIKDIAEVNIGHATRYGAMCYNDQGEVAGAVVMMLKGANSNEVIKNVKNRVELIQKNLPEGVIIETFLDRTKMVNNAINTVKTNLLEGALIVVFILVIFLGNLRAGLLVASVIPLSLLFAIIMMNLFGVSGNLMSLGALDFGLIIDGAVIIVEAVMHYMHHRTAQHSAQLTSEEMDGIVAKSSKKMMNSAVFGQIIILIVYLPIFTLQGVEGKMFKPMAQTVAFALLGAFILSISYIPMMSSLIISRKSGHKENLSDRMMNFLSENFSHTLKVVLKKSGWVLSATMLLFVFSLWVFTKLGGEFIPALEEGDFAVDTRVLTGSNLNTTIEFTQKAAKILLDRFPEVEKVVTKIGSGEVPTDPMPMEASDMMVILKDKHGWKSAKNFEEMEKKMSEALSEIPGITTGFQFPVQMRFNELMTGARQDVVCKIFGENLDSLVRYADQLAGIIKPINGAQDLYVEPITGMEQLVIEFDKLALAQYQINIADANKIINTSLAGQSSGLFFEDEKRFDIVVKLNAEHKKNLNDIKNILIPTMQATQIPLRSIAKVELKNGVNQIQREDAKRRIVVGFNVNGRDVQSIVNELKAKSNQMILAPGYFITYGGSFEKLEQAKGRLGIAVPIALILIFILLFFAFSSVKQGLLIYSAIPLSTIGGILFLALRGMPFSISAGIGFIALFGVAVLNGIVLISEFNHLRRTGIQSLEEIVIKGTKTRLRPVLMTACVASLGFLPMAISNGAGAEVQRPLATVVIGGLIIATFLTLYLLPILYVKFENWQFRPNRAKGIHFLFLFFGLNFIASSQEELSLNQSIEIALQNNHKLKIAALNEEFYSTQMKAAYIPNKAVLNSEVGQVNSVYFDSKFGLSQTFSLPKTKLSHKNLSKEEYLKSKIETKLTATELQFEIAAAYSLYNYLLLSKSHLLAMDSIYRLLVNKADYRVRAGESNPFEKMVAEQNLHEIKEKLILIQSEIEKNLNYFNFLLNASPPKQPQFYTDDSPYKAQLDTVSIQQTPILQYLKHNIAIQKAMTEKEKAWLWPEINLAINNTSFRGLGPDNNFYTSSDRFTSVQVGMSLSINSKPQKYKIKSSKIAEQMAQKKFDAAAAELNSRLERLGSQYYTLASIIEDYRSELIPKSMELIRKASIQYQSGEINYLDFVQIAKQSFELKQNYFETIYQYNQTVSEINYITIK